MVGHVPLRHCAAPKSYALELKWEGGVRKFALYIISSSPYPLAHILLVYIYSWPYTPAHTLQPISSSPYPPSLHILMANILQPTPSSLYPPSLHILLAIYSSPHPPVHILLVYIYSWPYTPAHILQPIS